MKQTSESEKNRRIRRFAVGVGGGAVLLIGVIAIPYPGPGWLIVFAGLAILAREFPWAARALRFGRDRYDAWNRWIKRQNIFVKSLTFIGTSIVVIVTIWLVNGYGLLNLWFDLNQDWLQSPFV